VHRLALVLAWLEVMVTFGEANYNVLPCCLKVTLKRSTDPSNNLLESILVTLFKLINLATVIIKIVYDTIF
jgi:hypothetical protein